MTPIMLTARIHTGLWSAAQRLHRDVADERGQGTVEYVGLAMAIGVLLLAVSSFLSGKDHGIGSIITGAIKSALQQASGGGK
jgi:Flp pilus assembly pilin Flp